MKMLRQRITDALKTSMKEKNQISVSTLRLILASIKDRDISARSKGNQDGVGDNELLSLLQSMIKQRHESVRLYEKGKRMELVEQEMEEISIIKSFLPTPLSDKELNDAVDKVIQEVGAKSIKEMGKVMGILKQKFAGRMDFAKASQDVKNRLE